MIKKKSKKAPRRNDVFHLLKNFLGLIKFLPFERSGNLNEKYPF